MSRTSLVTSTRFRQHSRLLHRNCAMPYPPAILNRCFAILHPHGLAYAVSTMIQQPSGRRWRPNVCCAFQLLPSLDAFSSSKAFSRRLPFIGRIPERSPCPFVEELCCARPLSG